MDLHGFAFKAHAASTTSAAVVGSGTGW
jgi:hypothetical protein